MREQETDGGTIEQVSPFWGDDTKRSGYRFRCGACGWLSPIMKWQAGAVAQEDRHDCPERGEHAT